ncbi:MAG: hypothetical protein AB7U59_13880 [Desulfovibrionaceae bacterium]
MEFEKAKKTIQRVLIQHAEEDIIKAAIVVTAALNGLSAERGTVFRIECRPATFPGADQQNS